MKRDRNINRGSRSKLASLIWFLSRPETCLSSDAFFLPPSLSFPSLFRFVLCLSRPRNEHTRGNTGGEVKRTDWRKKGEKKGKSKFNRRRFPGSRVVLIASSSASISRNYDLDCFSRRVVLPHREEHSDSAGSNSGDGRRAGSNERISFAIRRSRSNNYTGPSASVLKRLPLVFLVRQDRGDSRPNASAACRGSGKCLSRVCPTTERKRKLDELYSEK